MLPLTPRHADVFRLRLRLPFTIRRHNILLFPPLTAPPRRLFYYYAMLRHCVALLSSDCSSRHLFLHRCAIRYTLAVIFMFQREIAL